jgi:hypothetical protein
MDGEPSGEFSAERFETEAEFAIKALQDSGERFAVERSEEIKPGVPVRETNWQINSVEGGNVNISKPAEKPGKTLAKSVPVEEFTGWQGKWLLKIDDRVAKEAGLKKGDTFDPRLPSYRENQQRIYEQNGISPELLALRELYIRKITGV